MHNHYGFTLIEILAVLVVSSLLAGLLFGTFWQINRSVQSARQRMALYSKAMRVAHQLEKDVSGSCTPFHVLYEQEQEKKKKKEEAEKKAPTAPAPQQEQKKPAEQQQLKKPQHKPLNKIFYATSKEKKLELLTCITNNPLTVYWSDQAGKPTPKIARVVYRVKAEENDMNVASFALYRQESAQLDFNAFAVKEGKSKIREYKMADGIRSIECFFTTWVPAKKNEKEKVKKIVSVWDREKKEQQANDTEQKLLPDAVQLIITLWDNSFVREFSFTLTIPLMADSTFSWLGAQKEPKEDEKQTEQKKPAAKPPVPGMPGGMPAPPKGAPPKPPTFDIGIIKGPT